MKPYKIRLEPNPSWHLWRKWKWEVREWRQSYAEDKEGWYLAHFGLFSADGWAKSDERALACAVGAVVRLRKIEDADAYQRSLVRWYDMSGDEPVLMEGVSGGPSVAS